MPSVANQFVAMFSVKFEVAKQAYQRDGSESRLSALKMKHVET